VNEVETIEEGLGQREPGDRAALLIFLNSL
jgi:hypothetical protein